MPGPSRPPTRLALPAPSAQRVTPLLLAALLLAPLRGDLEAQTRAPAEGALAPAVATAGYGSVVVAAGGDLFVGSPGVFPFFPAPANRPGMVLAYGPDLSSGMGFDLYQTISAPEGTVGDGFGTAIAVAGDRMVVGAPGGFEGNGGAYVFSRGADGRSWESVGVYTADAEGNGLGSAVEIDGGAALVGAPLANDGAGAVMIMGGDGDVVTLRPEEPVAGERFGTAIAVRGDRMAIGAPGPALADLAGIFGTPPAPQPGSVYLFERGADGWVQTARVTKAEAGPAMFGMAVAWTADDAFVAGAPFAGGTVGELREIALVDGEWTERSTIGTEIQGQGFLGSSVTVSGDRILSGAPVAGLAILFERSAGDSGSDERDSDASGSATWTEVARMNTDAPQSFFGNSVALAATTAWVGEPGANLFSGRTAEFRLEGGEWMRAEPMNAVEPASTPITGEAVECSPEGTAAGYMCTDVDLLAFIPMDAVGADVGTMANDVWGWTDPEDGREYVLMGTTDATVFVDVTEAGAPRILGSLPLTEGAQENLWRDMKVYANHTFIVADQANAHGMQVFDLTRLRGLEADPSRVFDADALYDEMDSAHNIVINEDSGFAYIVGASSGGETCGGGLHMVDIREPKSPVFAGCFQDSATGMAGTGYSHDAQCINYHGPDEDYAGAEICFGANETALSIADVTDKSDPRVVSNATYPNSAYLHQGWVSDDHRWFFMNDEGDELAGTVPRTRTLVWDIQDLDDPILLAEHLGETAASDHNLYVRGQYMYQANYVSGLRILDVSDPENLVEVAYFDTVGGEDAPGFAGAFSNYPYFESGTIAVTSMREGLFLLKQRIRRTVFD